MLPPACHATRSAVTVGSALQIIAPRAHPPSRPVAPAPLANQRLDQEARDVCPEFERNTRFLFTAVVDRETLGGVLCRGVVHIRGYPRYY